MDSSLKLNKIEEKRNRADWVRNRKYEGKKNFYERMHFLNLAFQTFKPCSNNTYAFENGKIVFLKQTLVLWTVIYTELFNVYSFSLEFDRSMTQPIHTTTTNLNSTFVSVTFLTRSQTNSKNRRKNWKKNWRKKNCPLFQMRAFSIYWCMYVLWIVFRFRSTQNILINKKSIRISHSCVLTNAIRFQ